MKTIALFLLLAFVASTTAQWASFKDSSGVQFWQNTFDTGTGAGQAQFGLSLPAATQTSFETEYIGRFVVPIPSTGTWFGISHRSSMTNSLLLALWNDGNQVRTSFRYANGYVEPDLYDGNATLTPISSTVNSTHFTLSYRCQDCWAWTQDGVAASQIPSTASGAVQVIGWAAAAQPPVNPADADTDLLQHANQDIFAGAVASARNTAYTSWVSLAKPTSTIGPTTTSAPTATSTPVRCAMNSPITTQTWDYIVVGAGAGGIPIADKLSESGAKVLLLEKGPASSGRWGGNIKPQWLRGTNLTRFDVPGLDNEIWVDSAGIACPDVGTMAGCILGGGTAINAGLWWKPYSKDFDYNFPTGWKSADMQNAISRVFQRIPFTQTPSADGKIYKPEGYNIVAGALAKSGWSNVTADNSPDAKNLTFSHPNHMFNHGERGGPLATYLVTANARSNFKLVMNTAVNRVLRTGGHATGVEVQAFLDGGLCGTINLTPNTGRIVLSAGAFGSAKVLFRSGIGPVDQLNIVASAEAGKMISNSSWINLPVGYNLDDHTNTDIVITHPNVSFYDFYAAYDSPIPADKTLYLNQRSGILAQSAPNLAVVAWEEIVGADGITRQLQWTARVESSNGITTNKSMTISQYLGRGAVSRGRATISTGLNMAISTVPYLQDQNDIAAVTAGIDFLKKSLSSDPSIQVVFPAQGQSTADFLAQYPLTTSKRSANHWIGTCKMGTDTTAVVDLDTQVIGTENVFVVDASVFPGMVAANPSAYIVSVAERASERILALKPTTGTVPAFAQCGGITFKARTCASGLVCKVQNPYYSQCLSP